MANMIKTPPSSASKSPSGFLVFISVFLIVLIVILLIRQRIFDAIKLYHYTPPSEIVLLANEDTMNNYTKHVFYVNHPMVVPTVGAFRIYCPEDETDIVLGCYHVGQNGIYIYAVNDPGLSGVEQVTAAHEVLHAVYARLTTSARETLDQELESYYKHGLVNSRVAAEVQLYQKTEPGSVYDEMSCTFGTEIADLPANLTQYYNQFFKDRLQIVAYEQQYQSAFTTRQNEVTSDDQELSSLNQQINQEQQQLQTQLAQINAERAVLQNLSNTNELEYNAEVPSFNQLISSYNSGVNTLQANIADYNQIVASRNSIAGAFDHLANALNTSVTTPQAKQ
jgi:hypothetical protein